jgi:hypothetical protein
LASLKVTVSVSVCAGSAIKLLLGSSRAQRGT